MNKKKKINLLSNVIEKIYLESCDANHTMILSEYIFESLKDYAKDICREISINDDEYKKECEKRLAPISSSDENIPEAVVKKAADMWRCLKVENPLSGRQGEILYYCWEDYEKILECYIYDKNNKETVGSPTALKDLLTLCKSVISKTMEKQRINAETGGMLDEFDDTGSLTIHNFEAFLRCYGVSVRYNVLSHRMEIYGFEQENHDRIIENAPTLIYNELHTLLDNVTETRICDMLFLIATRNEYNPVLDLIKAKKWDEKDRLAEIYEIFGIPESDTLSRLLIKKWLMQCYCGLYNTLDNPFSLDIVLIFQGNQGIGKTRFFEKLAISRKYFGEGETLDPKNKDTIIEATSKWICELGEISSTFKKDMNVLKAFITKSEDEYRPPYGRTTSRYPRMTSFCGTTNDKDFLVDETGNRRYATVPIGDDVYIDYETQVKDFDSVQLWAQVAQIVETEIKERGSSYAGVFRLNREELEQLDKRNNYYLKSLPAEHEVMDIIQEETTEKAGYIIEWKYMTVTQFKELHPCLSRYSVNQISKVLNKLGYIQETKRIEGSEYPLKVRKLPYRYNQEQYDRSRL